MFAMDFGILQVVYICKCSYFFLQSNVDIILKLGAANVSMEI